MKKLVFQKDSKLYLDSCMGESTFAKSRIASRLQENGFLAKRNSDGWNFEPWCFNGTQQSANLMELPEEMSAAQRAMYCTVLLEGEAFSGRTLMDYFEAEANGESKAQCTFAAALVVSVMEEAVTQKVNLLPEGASGIFISDSFDRIIFLPPKLFDQCALCSGTQSYAEHQGFFIHQNLSESAAINFEQSVITYRIFTGRFPFTQTDTYKRHQDCLDHNFVPLRNCIWGLSQELSFFVDNSLMRRQKNSVRVAGKTKGKKTVREHFASKIMEDTAPSQNTSEISSSMLLHFPLQLLYKELGLESDGSLSGEGTLHSVVRTSETSEAQFHEKAKREQEKFQKQLKNKRFFRKNRTLFSIITVACLATFGFIFGIWSGHQDYPTSMSLSSMQTIEMLLSGYNRLDVLAVQGSAKGRDASLLEDTITSYYVAAKTRSTYNTKDTTVTPAEWLIYNRNLSYSINGMTQLFIDNTKGDLYFEAPKRKEKPQPLTVQDGTTLLKGDSETHSAQYYILFNDGPETLHIGKHNDKITLTYNGKQWIVTGIDQNIEFSEVPLKEFKEDYSRAMEETQNDPVAAATVLYEKYPFVNTESEVLAAQNFIHDQFKWIEK